MLEPYREELWRNYVAEGCTPRSRWRFVFHSVSGFAMALVYATPYYLRGPRSATRIFGMPVVFLAAATLGLTVLIRDCAYIGLALNLTR